jgi:endonuclease I
MIKRVSLFSALLISATSLFANIDMQAHVGTDEARQAYDQYVERQAMYYEDDCAYHYLRLLTGDELFGRLNSLMGSTCRIASSSLDYGTLRYAYVSVDTDLNKPGNIIGYYNGTSFAAVWDNGNTWNREHTWPQSKGVKKEKPMGYDMQSVRPTLKSVNSSRGNDAYGENGSCYDPDEVAIKNDDYRPENLGSYRGDAARVIIYDYIVYGEAGGYKNQLYNGAAQLLNKLGSAGVFESIPILIKWHMQDPPSLTEMVRNDGAQDYQGNRNPMIDYPELALQIFLNHNSVNTYDVTVESSATMWPAHQYTLSDGFIAYLTHTDGSHPTEVSVSGAQYTYDPQLGRLTITKVTAAVTISTSTSSVENITYNSSATIYTLSGTVIAQCTADELNATLQALVPGTYIIKQGATITKVLL